jgi:hypothetical protein
MNIPDILASLGIKPETSTTTSGSNTASSIISSLNPLDNLQQEYENAKLELETASAYIKTYLATQILCQLVTMGAVLYIAIKLSKHGK